MAGTSLAEQLKKLAVPQTSILVHSKKRTSLLYNPKDAADIDRATFYKIGLSGLEELKSIYARLAEFEKSLFDETSLHLERAVEDQQANAKLDQLINRFLILLSPYLNLDPAHKALEWLICRFHIHQYNIDSIMALIMPYHDTNIFARMIQILPLEGRGGKWIWLQPLKKEGIPMSKIFLLSRASSDTSFFKFICNLPLQGVQVHGEESVRLTTLFAFYCTTVIGALHQSPHVSEVQVTHLLPSLIAGLSSCHLDFAASAFMILGYLVTKIHLTPRIFSELFYKVCKSDQSSLRSEVTLALVVMCQSHVGHTPSLLPSFLHLATSSWFLSSLAQQARDGVVVYPLVAAVITDCLTANNTTLQDFVSQLLAEIAFNNDEARNMVKLFADKPLVNNEWFRNTLHQLEKSYPEAFDEAVKVHSNLLGLMPDYSARNELFQKLNHPQWQVRLQAIVHIKSHMELLKEQWVQETLLTRLSDDKTQVLVATLDLASHLPQMQLNDQLITLIARCWHKFKLHSVAPEALARLQSSQAEPDPTLVLLLTLPFLLPSDEKEVEMTTAINVLKCTAVRQNNLLKSFIEELENEVVEPKSLPEKVFKFLQKGLEGVDLDSVLKAGKHLEPHGNVYQLMTLLVSAAVLPINVSIDNITSLLQRLAEYNSSSELSSDVRKDLDGESLGHIVSSCRDNKLPFQGSLYILSKVMRKIKYTFPEKNHIFDVKDPRAALMINIFKLAIKMKTSRNKYIRKAYSSYCEKMFEKCCETPESQIHLLSNVALGCPEIAAECMAWLGLLVEESACLTETECVLVPALLVALHSPKDDVRHNALTVLQSLAQKLALPVYHKLLDLLTQHYQEIQIDHEQITVVLYMHLSPDPSVKSLQEKAQRQEMANVLTSLMDIIIAPGTPMYVRSYLLQLLDQINSQSLLEKLVPLAMNILRSPLRSEEESSVLTLIVKRVCASTASALSVEKVWLFVETCLKDHKPLCTNGALPAVLMLLQIDKELFATLSTELQRRLLSLIVSCVATAESSEVTSAATSCVKRVTLDAAVVASLLEPMTADLPPTPVSSATTTKRGWTVKKPPSLELLTSTHWRQGLCLLEFIQNKKKLENVELLLPRLFQILNRCLQFEEQSPVEYTKQALLGSLLQCCVKLSPDGRPVDLPEASLQVELVVECIRVSQNPQTHHHALLLLAHMANMIPERVLHSIMPIFTFMGSSVLRQDDAYSFQIISKIVETIIPILMKSKAVGADLTPELVGVLRVFAGALLDIPEHRRIPLFTKLLTTLREGHFLWVLLALVFESHVLHPSQDNSAVKESGSIPKRLEVGLHLCHHFNPATVLSAACRLIHYLCALPVDKNDKKMKIFKKSTEGALFDVEKATDKQLRHYTYTGLTFLSFLLSSKQFLRLMAALSLEEVQDLKDIFQQIFEGVLTLTQIVSKQVDTNSGQLTTKYWKSMLNICFDVMAKVNALLPEEMFLHVVTSLLDHQLISLRCKALELLNWRLQQARPLDSAQLLTLLPPLVSLVRSTDSSQSENQLMQQTALLSIKFLARQLAASHPEYFQQAFKAATRVVKKRSIHDPVLASAVLCVGELCHTLGAHAIACLPDFMPPIIAVLGNHSLPTSGELLLLSVVSAVHKVVDSLACFLSPYLAQLLQQLCVLSGNCTASSDNPKLQPVLQKIKAIKQKISADVPLRVLLPAVAESYSQLISCAQLAAVSPLLSLLGDSFKAGTVLTPELTAFLLSALDFRCQAASRAEIEAVEPPVITAIIALVFKLSESSFRPFYYKIFNWAFQSGAHKDRSITFYRLTCGIAEGLKGLFVSFAHYFLKNASMLLDANNISKQELDWSEEKAAELVEAILKALHTVFVHDASHFVNKERFDTLMQPIVDQLENELGGRLQMEQRNTDLVIPCLTQMAVSAADDTLWKQLNYQILLKTRHNNFKVRIGGILAVCEVAKKLGEEFLPLLPETVPFLAELLEDENENVEKASQRVVQELEAALGEQISKYF